MMLTSLNRHARNTNAHQKVKKAIEAGTLERPDTCELCGRTPEPIEVSSTKCGVTFRYPIYAHHWNGHHNALDVWWICQICNGQLRGDEFHSGVITKSEARQLLKTSNRI